MDIQALMNVVLKLSTQVETLARQQAATAGVIPVATAATTAIPEPAAILPPAPAVPVAAAVQQPLFAIVTPPSTGDNGSPSDVELTRFNSIGSSASSCAFVTPLTRFNSIGSAASSSSFASSSSSSTLPKQSAKKKLSFKRRRRANALTSHYRSRVRKPILELLDEKYLVPEESPLFQRVEGTSHKLPDGSYKLKTHAELNLPLFQKLVRPLLLQMLGSQMYKSTNKVNKLVDAMKFVVKKRRANHNYRRGKKIPLCAIYRSTGFQYEVDLDALPEPVVSDLFVPALPEPTLPEPVVPEPALPKAVVPEAVVPEPALPEPTLPEPVLSEPALPEPPTVKAAPVVQDSDSDSDTIDLDATESEHDSDLGEILSDLFATDDDLDIPSTDEDYDPPTEVPCSGFECNKVMPIADSYPQLPKQMWGDQEDVAFYCEPCWEKRKTDLFAKLGAKYPQPKKRKAPVTKQSKRKAPVTKKSKRKAPVTKKPKRKAPVTKKPKRKAKKPKRKAPTPNTPPQRVVQPVGTPEPPNNPKFPVGTTQNAKWTDGKFYTAHITKYHEATKTYDVYFPDDAETIDGLPENKIQPPLSATGCRSRPRESFIGEKFLEPGDQTVQPGMFQVKLVVDNVHEYVCERLTGENPGEMINYDVGCVIRGVLDNTSIVNL